MKQLILKTRKKSCIFTILLVVSLVTSTIKSNNYAVAAENCVFSLQKPAPFSILSDRVIPIEASACSCCTSASLYIQHFFKKWDTVHLQQRDGRWTGVWNREHITQDHDIINLKYRYAITDSTKDSLILSGYIPTLWMIKDNPTRSSFSYKCSYIPHNKNIVIDGKFDDWKQVKKIYFADQHSYSRLCWKNGFLYCNWQVYDSTVEYNDQIEFCFDIPNVKPHSLDLNQRVLIFTPSKRFFCWAFEKKRDSLVQMDSVIICSRLYISWSSEKNKAGYAGEAEIPFSVLSDLLFPPSSSGFNISVVKYQSDIEQTPDILTIANTPPSNRFSPDVWPTLRFAKQHPLFYYILLSILSGLLIAWFMITALKVYHLYSSKDIRQKNALIENFQKSPMHSYMEKHWHEPTFTLEVLYSAQNMSSEQCNEQFSVLQTTFEHYLSSIRIAKSKEILKSGLKITDKNCQELGFTSLKDFETAFQLITGFTQERWQKQWLENKKKNEEPDDDD